MKQRGFGTGNTGRAAPEIGRRSILRFGIAGLATLAGHPAAAALQAGRERSIAFHNVHTDEAVKATYWANGVFLADGLREIDFILRDFRTDEVRQIDRGLLDLLYTLKLTTGSGEPFQVISGYRSPRTNAALAKASVGVAKRSLHLEGKAVDISLPDVDLADLRQAALELQAGGVGYYPRSGFVHVDTGRVRFW